MVDVTSLFWKDEPDAKWPIPSRSQLNPPTEDMEEWLRENCTQPHSWLEGSKYMVLYFHKDDFDVAIEFKLIWL